MNVLHYFNTAIDRKLGPDRACVLRHRVNAGWGTLCSTVVLFLICSTFFMKIQQPGIVAIKAPRDQLPVVQVAPNDASYVTSPIELSQVVKKAVYSAYLTDTTGTVVFSYPEIVLDNLDGSHGPDGLSFRIPNIAPGMYYLNAKVTYALNPLKEAQLDIELVRVVIN